MKNLYAPLLKTLTISFVVLFAGFLGFMQQASALVGGIPATLELDGYAWSENIGWVSLNCKTGGLTGNNICATSNYAVTINIAGNMFGYGWSSNIGWVKFGSLSDYPVSAGNPGIGGVSTNNPARVTGLYPDLTMAGWARACAGTLSAPGSCNDSGSRTDGWDGWIALKGTNHSVQMNAGGMVSDSYAWGGTVVGWVDMFSHVKLLAPSQITGTGCQIPVGSGTCSGLVTWNMSPTVLTPRVFNTSQSVLVASTLTGLNQAVTLNNGNNVIELRNNLTALGASVTLTASCVPGADFSNGTTCQPTAVPAPAITMTSSRAVVRSGDTVALTWTISPEPLASGTCTLSGPGLSGARTNSGNQSSTALKSKTKFSITCVGGYGTVSASAVVEVIATAQEV